MDAPAALLPAVQAFGALAARALPAFLDVTLKATLVLLAAHAATRWAMRRSAAATRHLVWSAAVAAVLALPVLAAVAPRWTAPPAPAAALRAAAALAAAVTPAAPNTTPADVPDVFPEAPAAAAAAAAPLGVADAAAARAPRHGERHGDARGNAPGAAAATGRRPSPAPPAAAAAPPLILWAAGLWAAGALAVLARLALGTVGLARLVRRARPADDPAWVMPMQRLARELGVRRPVTLLVGRTGTVPVTWGVVYPVVLLPADAAEWGAERRRLVLLHELAHVARLDAFTQALAQLATALFWFHPLATLAARRLRAERERACDDLVLAAGVRATAYADDLLDLVRTLGDASPAAAALAMARRSEFEGRLLAILDPRVPRARTSARRALAAAALAGAVAVPLAGMRAAAARPPAPNAGQPNAESSDAERRAARRPAAAHLAEQPPTAGAPDAPPAPPAPRPASPAPPAPPAPAGAALGAVHGLAAAAAPTRDGCSRVRGRYFVAGGPGTTYRVVDDTLCLEVRTRGAVEFTDDYADVRDLPAGALLVVTETRAGGPTRRMEVTPAAGGRPARRYTVDGAERPAAEGAGWFRRVLAGPVRRGGLDVEARVARLRREGGAAAVLAAARRQADAGVRRRYLDALLAGPALAPAELEQVALAARALDGDGDRAAVLRRVAARGAGSPAVTAAVVGAARAIAGDGDRRRVLEQTTADPGLTPEAVADLARAAGGISSDGDKAAVLVKLAPRAAASDAARAAFYQAVGTFTSDGDRKRVLLAALAASGDARLLVPTLDALAPVTSDGDRTEVLAAVAARRPFERADVRTRYFALVDAMASETARERALLATLSAAEPCPEAVRAVLASATHFASDRSRADVLLGVAARTDALRRPESRAAFLAALAPMTSGAEYRRVMDAIVPK